MDFEFPQAIYFIFPVCMAWLLLAIYSQKRRERARDRFVDALMGDRIMPKFSGQRLWSKLFLQQVAIVAGLIAMAQPRFGEEIETVVPRGSDLYVLIDVSRSMLADDVKPSRLGRAKADVSSLVNRLQGERIGLIAFAGQAVVKCPLTVDYDSFRRALNELDPNSAPRGGTAIGDAIRKSLEVFQANEQRDQAILLITDGDDQQSYPMEAATAAAERKVTIFSIGLGDSTTGARIPEKTGNFVEHKGEQVWSKLDGSLLQEIALKTSGVYVPAGTRAYDLGELYSQYLQGKRGDDSTGQTRVRRSEQFQLFLMICLFALLMDMCISRFPKMQPTLVTRALCLPIILAFNSAAIGFDDIANIDPVKKVAEGNKFFAEQKFGEAQAAFYSANQKLAMEKSSEASIALFDEACAFHRLGDFDKARDRYLEAGLSQDRKLSSSAHFNLAMMISEQARTMAGDSPESVPPEKRQEILDKLKQSIGSYRHCLELDPKHAPSRKNLELVRQWIKVYTDRWAEIDRQKRRDETNLIQFLDYIMGTQKAIREMVQSLSSNATADRIAEIKRGQDELAQEIPVLRDKIASSLQPEPGATPPTPDAQKEMEEAIRLLQSWADESGEQMQLASQSLKGQEVRNAIPKQEAAIEPLDRVWNAIVDFRSLLNKELADQKKIAGNLKPAELESDNPELQEEPAQPVSPNASIENQVDFAALEKEQSTVLKKAILLAPKAEAELKQMEEQQEQPSGDQSDPTESTEPAEPSEPNAPAASEKPKSVDPEEVKKGLKLAMELAPKAVDQMKSAVDQLKLKESAKSFEYAEEARRILKEIADAQPKQPQQDQQQNEQDQKPNDQNQEENEDKEKEDENKEGDDDQSKEAKPEDKQEDKKEDESKQDSSKEDKDKTKDQQKSEKQPKPGDISKDRMEEALRKVREREQEKRERDKQLRARILGRTPVDKDW